MIQELFNQHSTDGYHRQVSSRIGWNHYGNHDLILESSSRNNGDHRFLRRFGHEKETVTLAGPILIFPGNVTNKTAKEFGYEVTWGAITSKGLFVRPKLPGRRFYEVKVDLDGNIEGYEMSAPNDVLLKVDDEVHVLFLPKYQSRMLQKYLSS